MRVPTSPKVLKGMERCGISGTASHISGVRSSSSLCGQVGDCALVASRLPVSLSTMIIDRVPRVCLGASRPRVKRNIVCSAAALLATVVSTDPHVSVVDSLVNDGGRRPRHRISRTTDAPKRKRKSTAAVAAAITDDAIATETELRRIAKALEKAYNENATTCESDDESLLKDLEAQTRSNYGDAVVVGEGAESCSSSTISNIRKRRGRPPKISVDHTSAGGLDQQPRVISTHETKDGFVMRCVPPVVVKRRVGEGKCRLNLVSRIALRKGRQDRSLQVRDACTNIVKAAQDIWCTEADSLIKSHGVALELGVVDWDNLKRGLLSAAEESELAHLMIPMQNFQKVRKTFAEAVGREPSDEEWAGAAQVDLHTFRRHLLIGKSARNKLIQHNLRLVLFQAHKYHRETSSLSLFDLCQEGVLGLMHGVDKFDPKKGHRFSTYAVYWVRNSILRAQTRSGSSLRSPYNVAMHKLNIKRARLELLMELERAPTDEEIRNRLGFSPERFRDIVRSSTKTKSIHCRTGVTGEELVETIADTSDLGRRMKVRSGDDGSLRFGIEDVLDSLKPKEGLVLRQRFGLDGKGERTLGEIGRNLGISREMVRKHEACALMKMKNPMHMDYLRSYLTSNQG